MKTKSVRFLLFTLALLSPTAFSTAAEIAPGRITNPGGLQRFQGAAYNSQDDEYMLIYQGDGFPRVRRLSVAGAFLAPVVLIDGAVGVSNVGIVYNPTENEYLALYRSDTTIFGRYLTNLGQPIGSRFVVGTGGDFGTAAYSITSDRYLVAWREGPAPVTVRYALIDGDSSSADPVLDRTALARGDNAHVAWGSSNDKFLVVYTREVGTLKEETFGKLVEGDGSDRSGEIAIMGGNRAQTNPQVGYASSHDVFLVSVEDWRKRACCRADVNGQRVDSNGNLVGGRFPIVNTGNGGWDVPGPIGFSNVTGQFISTSYIEPTGVAREINPADGSRGEKIIVGDQITVPIAITTRSHPDDPQALILSRANLGGDGVHAHILPLEIPPPSIAPTTLPAGQVGTFYSQAISVVGGTPPFSFEFVPGFGSITPGLSGPNASTGVLSGIPTTAGVFGFRVRVTDDDGRVAEADVTHTVGLAAPHLQSPIDLATGDQTPTFDWDPVPGASEYQLVVENLTNGGTPINQSNIDTTSFTPDSNLPAGKLYRWTVAAHAGAIVSPFAPHSHFELDTQPAPAIQLSGKVPDPLSQITGLTVENASSELGNKKKKENAVDGKNTTSWQSVGTASQQNEHITIDLGASYDVGQISLRSNRGPRFPVDFALQISDSPDSGFVTLASSSAFDATGNTWYDFPVTVTNGRYVRLLVTEKGFHKGSFWVEISEIRVLQAIDHMGSILYTFQAPADDAGSGKESVVTYDLRYMVGDADNFDWDAATQYSGEPTPASPGSNESILVQGLNDETAYAAAIASTDDAGNVAGMSNIVVVTTASIPPGPITDLQVVSAQATGTSIHLRWTAPPDNVGDNVSGPVAGYDIRCSTSPIANLAAFQALSSIPGPDPAAPGNTEDFDVAGLGNETTYFCGILAVDHTGLVSTLGGTASGSTLDEIAPDPITLSGEVPEPSSPITGLTVENASSEHGENKKKENAVDGENPTSWMSVGTGSQQNEHITIDLGASYDVGQVSVRSNRAPRFPVDFALQISDSPDSGFVTVASFSAFEATGNTWYDFPVTVTNGRYLRLLVTEKGFDNGSFWVEISEVRVFQSIDHMGSILYTFQAPADDAGSGNGSAASYDLRYMVGNAASFDWSAATPFVGEPTPGSFGSDESILVQGLNDETSYAAAVTSTDDGGNVAVVSNIVVVTTASVPPGAVTSLQVIDAQATGTSVHLQWTAPPDNVGDNASGPVNAYDLRCSTSPIPSMSAFQALPSLPGPEPAAPGTTENFDVLNLDNQTNYHCGVLALDHTGLRSPLGSTNNGSTLDDIPPAPVANLNVKLSVDSLPPASVEASAELNASFVTDNAIDGNPDTRWSTPSRSTVTTEFITLDFGSPVDVNLVRLQAPDGNSIRFPRDFTIQVSEDDVLYTVVHSESDLVATDGTWYDFPFTSTSARYVKIEVTEQNESFGKYFTQIAEIEALDPSGPLVQARVTWSGSGDDGNKGIATSYEIRHATAEITEANFDGATLPPGSPPLPSPPGTKETFVIGAGLAPGVATWFAVETADDQDNTSLAVVSHVTPST